MSELRKRIVELEMELADAKLEVKRLSDRAWFQQ